MAKYTVFDDGCGPILCVDGITIAQSNVMDYDSHPDYVTNRGNNGITKV